MNVYTLRLTGPDVEWVLGVYSHPQLARAAADTHAEAFRAADIALGEWHIGDDGDAIREVKREGWADYYSVDRKELDSEAWP